MINFIRLFYKYTIMSISSEVLKARNISNGNKTIECKICVDMEEN